MRLFDLWLSVGDGSVERREFNRLSEGEQIHIADMIFLLNNGDEFDGRQRLRRKLDLFRSRGRISSEDYDIFSRAEWLAVMKACGISQGGYDRLADRELIEQVEGWLQAMDETMSLKINSLEAGDK